MLRTSAEPSGSASARRARGREPKQRLTTRPTELAPNGTEGRGAAGSLAEFRAHEVDAQFPIEIRRKQIARDIECSVDLPAITVVLRRR